MGTGGGEGDYLGLNELCDAGESESVDLLLDCRLAGAREGELLDLLDVSHEGKNEFLET
jgi:hypothetical protein